MYNGVIKVEPKSNYKLLLTFDNNEVREFNMSEYLEIGKFKELKESHIFNSVKVSFDTVEWSNGVDIDPEFLYEKSTKIS